VTGGAGGRSSARLKGEAAAEPLWSAGVLAGWPGAVSAPRSLAAERRRDAAGPAAGTAPLQWVRAEVRRYVALAPSARPSKRGAWSR